MSFPSTIEPAESAIFLNIRSRVSTAGNEAGLLGLVSDPIFEANGHFYVYYSASGPGWPVVSWPMPPASEYSPRCSSSARWSPGGWDGSVAATPPGTVP